MIPIRIQTEEGIQVVKDKFLISEDVTGLELQRHVLKYLEREISQGLYFFIADKSRHRMLQPTVLIREPYHMYKNGRGYLDILVMKQNVF